MPLKLILVSCAYTPPPLEPAILAIKLLFPEKLRDDLGVYNPPPKFFARLKLKT